MKAFVVDLETLGKGEAARILSIGVVCVDLDQLVVVDRFYVTVSQFGQEDRTVDPDTAKWWESQKVENYEAYQHAFEKSTDGYAGTLFNQLDRLARWMEPLEPDVSRRQLFGNGPEFDNKILEHAYGQCGLEVPWKYSKNQSIRTIALIGKSFFGFDHYEMFFEGVKHYALDDAAHEAKVLLKVWADLGRVVPERLDGLEIGQTVYVYSDPRHVVVPENSPVWKCTVTGWRTFDEVRADIGERKRSVQVNLDNGFSDFSRDLKEVFFSFDEAKRYAHERMDEHLDKSVERHGKLVQALSALMEQKEDDD